MKVTVDDDIASLGVLLWYGREAWLRQGAPYMVLTPAIKTHTTWGLSTWDSSRPIF